MSNSLNKPLMSGKVPSSNSADGSAGGWVGAALTAREKLKMHGFILRLTGNMLQVLAHMSMVRIAALLKTGPSDDSRKKGSVVQSGRWVRYLHKSSLIRATFLFLTRVIFQR